MLIVKSYAQRFSVSVRGRKLKGKNMGRSVTIPLDLCKKFDIDVGDTLELELKKVVKQKAEDITSIGVTD